MTPDMQVLLGKLHLRNPVMVAAGTFGYGLEYRDWVDLAQLGAVVTKSLTLAPRMGNPPPRVAETPAGMLNAIGLQNDGVDAFLVETLPRLRETGATVVASVAGETLDEYVQVAAKLARAEGVAALELNLSCPNQARGGMEFGVQPDLTAQVVAAVRQTTDLPLIAKLSPNGGDITPSAQAAVDAGADIVCLINTLLGVAVDAAQTPVSPREQGRRAVGTRDQAHRAVSPLARAPSLARYAPDWRRGHQQRRGCHRVHPAGRARGAGRYGELCAADAGDRNRAGTARLPHRARLRIGGGDTRRGGVNCRFSPSPRLRSTQRRTRAAGTKTAPSRAGCSAACPPSAFRTAAGRCPPSA
jgi:dihydroorotate dehydrogenase subfamily 1